MGQVASPGPWRERVLTWFDDRAGEVVASLQELVRIPSVSGSEAENEVQAVLAARMPGLGLEVDHWPVPLAQTLAEPGFPGVEVERTEAWGLVGALRGRGDGPSLMLDAHVDVVPTGEPSTWRDGHPFSGALRGGSVHGRGACDMKGGLVAAWWAVRALSELGVPLRGDVLLATVLGEEDGGLGTWATLARGWRADACVIPEPTSLDLVPASAGALTFRLSVHGLATHASRRTSGVSAVEKFWPVFAALRALEERRSRGAHPLMSRWDVPYPIEIGRVRSGDWPSSVPDLLVAEGRYGVALDEPVEQARDRLEEAVALACAGDPWLRDHPVQVQWWGGSFAPGRTGADAAILAAVRSAHAAVARRPQQTWGAPYGSDLRLLNAAGVPTVHYGPGDAALAHGPDESVPVEEVLIAARVLAVLAIDRCGVG